ncbi:MAG: pyridoxal phosphate-dependent aminotransferase [Verrucomicrobia bacterium]|nr:pyridoxal phosphate-dependent aminotransferase [Verrucomicrobiota bacterium]MBI3871179.1 pyridoxal phosphate-dependent aminotransferase [Verrucomicrobiota bacterium]
MALRSDPDSEKPGLGPSARLQGVQSPIIPVVARLIRENPGTLSLGQGVVSYGPPPTAIEALLRGMSDPENHKYRPVGGLPDLIEAFAQKLDLENGIAKSDDRALMVTAGSNLGFTNALLAIADPGDEVILQTPYYFNHEMAITMASCRPVLVPTDARYQLDLDGIRKAITPRTRAVVTISPNNPTGAVYPSSDLKKVNQLCAEAGVFHIHDEAYEHFVYNGASHYSPASDPSSAPHTVSLFSMSKGFGFASWRIGFLLAPRSLTDALMKIQDTLLICAPVASQFAALGALEAGRSWPNRHAPTVLAARAAVRSGLSKIADCCDVPVADGAFYYLIRVHSPRGPLDVATELVRRFGVAVVPGTAFGAPGCCLRVSYGALTAETAEGAMERLVTGLRALTRASG